MNKCCIQLWMVEAVFHVSPLPGGMCMHSQWFCMYSGPDELFGVPHTNVRRGPFLVREARIFLSVVVTFKRTLNVQTSKQRGKKLAADRRGAHWRRGPPPMVRPAQWIIRPCMYCCKYTRIHFILDRTVRNYSERLRFGGVSSVRCSVT